MCSLFANLYVLSTWGPHMVYMQVPIYILYVHTVYDQVWLVGILSISAALMIIQQVPLVVKLIFIIAIYALVFL